MSCMHDFCYKREKIEKLFIHSFIRSFIFVATETVELIARDLKSFFGVILIEDETRGPRHQLDDGDVPSPVVPFWSQPSRRRRLSSVWPQVKSKALRLLAPRLLIPPLLQAAFFSSKAQLHLEPFLRWIGRADGMVSYIS